MTEDAAGDSAGERPHAITLSFDYPAASRARTVERSVGVEAGEIDDERSAATVDRDGGTVRVRVDAADLVALRAATNTWLRLLGVAESVAATAGEAGASATTAGSDAGPDG